ADRASPPANAGDGGGGGDGERSGGRRYREKSGRSHPKAPLWFLRTLTARGRGATRAGWRRGGGRGGRVPADASWEAVPAVGRGAGGRPSTPAKVPPGRVPGQGPKSGSAFSRAVNQGGASPTWHPPKPGRRPPGNDR